MVKSNIDWLHRYRRGKPLSLEISVEYNMRDPELLKESLVGLRVQKVAGYKFSGEIVADFYNRAGERRFVVETLKVKGLLRIFSAEQLKVGIKPKVRPSPPKTKVPM